jgi:hypothetical protein
VFYFILIQAPVFRIPVVTIYISGLRTSQRADLLQGCANLHACDQGTLSYPPSALDALLSSAILVASHLNIKNNVTASKEDEIGIRR